MRLMALIHITCHRFNSLAPSIQFARSSLTSSGIHTHHTPVAVEGEGAVRRHIVSGRKHGSTAGLSRSPPPGCKRSLMIGIDGSPRTTLSPSSRRWRHERGRNTTSGRQPPGPMTPAQRRDVREKSCPPRRAVAKAPNMP